MTYFEYKQSFLGYVDYLKYTFQSISDRASDDAKEFKPMGRQFDSLSTDLLLLGRDDDAAKAIGEKLQKLQEDLKKYLQKKLTDGSKFEDMSESEKARVGLAISATAPQFKFVSETEFEKDPELHSKNAEHLKSRVEARFDVAKAAEKSVSFVSFRTVEKPKKEYVSFETKEAKSAERQQLITDLEAAKYVTYLHDMKKHYDELYKDFTNMNDHSLKDTKEFKKMRDDFFAARDKLNEILSNPDSPSRMETMQLSALTERMKESALKYQEAKDAQNRSFEKRTDMGQQRYMMSALLQDSAIIDSRAFSDDKQAMEKAVAHGKALSSQVDEINKEARDLLSQQKSKAKGPRVDGNEEMQKLSEKEQSRLRLQVRNQKFREARGMKPLYELKIKSLDLNALEGDGGRKADAHKHIRHSVKSNASEHEFQRNSSF